MHWPAELNIPSRNVEKKRYQDPVLWEWLGIVFTPFPSYVFLPNILNGTTKAPAVDILRLTTLRDTKTTFLSPKWYDKHFRSFYVSAPLSLGDHRDFTNTGHHKAWLWNMFVRLFVRLLFQNKRLEGEAEKNEQQIEKYKSDMKKVETENKVRVDHVWHV